MKILNQWILMAVLAFAGMTPQLASAKGKKKPPLSITFHVEANSNDGRKFSIPVETALGKKFIQRVPSISTTDIIAYRMFLSPHSDESYGVTLQLSNTAANRLKHLSTSHKGRYIVANINGQVVDMLFIDKEVDGRIITIWRNVDPKFINIINPILPKIGETKKKWKARLKAEKRLRK